jgi:hypothetical protein
MQTTESRAPFFVPRIILLQIKYIHAMASSGIHPLEAGSELTSRPGHSPVLNKHLKHVRCSRPTPCCQAVTHCTNDVYIAGTQTMYSARSRGRPGSGESGLRVAGEWNTFRYWLLEFVLQVVLNQF